MISKEEKICQEYLSTLERLFETVQSQTVCLQNNDWPALTSILGKKENIHLSLQNMDEQIQRLLNENKLDSNLFKKKVKRLIQYIQSIEDINKKMIAESMEQIGSELSQLNLQKKMYKTYLDSNIEHRQTGVNLVS